MALIITLCVVGFVGIIFSWLEDKIKHKTLSGLSEIDEDSLHEDVKNKIKENLRKCNWIKKDE